jgi:ADP-heptose:LPS heptosyltransferase
VEDKSLHVSEMFQKIVETLPTTSAETPVQAAKPLGRLAVQKRSEPTIAFFVDAPVPERIWPPEYFAKIADFAIEKWNAAVIVISSNERPDLASRVQKACRHPDRLSIFTDLTLPELAGVIASADLLISNDTGPMHIGPAVGVQTLGLFSVGYPEHFRPIGSSNRYLRGNPIEAIAIEDVIETVEEMWATVDRDLRR